MLTRIYATRLELFESMTDHPFAYPHPSRNESFSEDYVQLSNEFLHALDTLRQN